MSHSPPSIPSIFPANKSESGGSASTEMDQIVPQYSHSISSIFPPYKSTECSESNERHPQPQFSNSISSIFPPNKSTESSESNERPTTESTNSTGSPSKLSIQSEYNNQLQAALQKLIEEVRHTWTYAIMWGLSYDHSGMPFLRWADGYYKGSDDYHMETNNRTEKPLSVVLEEQEILASATDEEDVTNTEWFFLKSKTQCFLNGSGLPGQAFHTEIGLGGRVGPSSDLDMQPGTNGSGFRAPNHGLVTLGKWRRGIGLHYANFPKHRYDQQGDRDGET